MADSSAGSRPSRLPRLSPSATPAMDTAGRQVSIGREPGHRPRTSCPSVQSGRAPGGMLVRYRLLDVFNHVYGARPGQAGHDVYLHNRRTCKYEVVAELCRLARAWTSAVH